MFKNIENLEIVNAYFGTSLPNKTHFVQKPGHGLSFKSEGETVYTFENQELVLHENEISFLPKNSTYYSQRIGENGSYSMILFNADIKNPKPHIFNIDFPSEVKIIFDSIVKLSCFDTAVNNFEKLSLFYKLLSLLEKNYENNIKNSYHQKIIAPALEYLEKNMFNCNLEVGALHKLCGISDTYFRKIFISEFNMSPKKYIIEKRLHYAQNLLETEKNIYIYEVSEKVGFDDPLYFSKIFKKRFGCSPSISNRD